MASEPATRQNTGMVWPLVLAWIIGTALASSAFAWREWGRTVARFERDADDFHRLVAQRIDQHDAHMTGLSALLAVSSPPPLDAIRAVSSNISQFYPRVSSIDIVQTEPAAVSMFSTRSQSTAPPVTEIVAAARKSQGGSVMVPLSGSRYVLVKSVPQPVTPRYLIALQIDATTLVASELGDTVDVTLQAAPTGQSIYASSRWSQAAPVRHLRLETRRQLSSLTQPLDLLLRRDIAIASLLPLSLVLVTATVVSGGLWLLRFVVNERRATRAAAARADTSAQEARLAHALRINTMGELSLGIAHELAQPLAALLAQSQAGLRIVKSGRFDQGSIEGVLEANARHAKRAGELLAKLRDWVSVEPAPRHSINLDEIISGIVALNEREFSRAGIELVHAPCDRQCITAADAIGIEQIAQNLITNARDACLNADPRGTRVTVAVFAASGQTGFRVTDDGEGIAADVAAHLFEPFATTKYDGMGLGLSISRRLVERFAGTIRPATRTDGRRGTVFTVMLPAQTEEQVS